MPTADPRTRADLAPPPSAASAAAASDGAAATGWPGGPAGGFSQLLAALDQGVLTLTLNRPDTLNAYTATMGRELARAFRAADADDAVRVVVVTGAGRGFCAGADLSGGADSFGAGGGEAVFGSAGGGGAGRDEDRFVQAIFECRKPSIAALNGAAVGVGLTMTLPMDIRLVAQGAKLGFVFARRGLVPEAGSAWFLPRIVGLPQALRWCLSGALFGADEALRGGLVSEVLAPEALLPQAQALAREIATHTAPVAIALTRQLLWRAQGEATPDPVLAVDAALARTLGAGPDVREGVAAFLARRTPQFPGRVSTDMPPQYPWWDANAARRP